MTTYAEIGTALPSLHDMSAEKKSWWMNSIGIGFFTLCMIAILFGRIE